MCGIAGVIAVGEPLGPKAAEEVRGMTAMLRHRGPDGTGFARDDRCVLGNTRLKIIHLSDSANLPMSNDDGTVHIAYNGEVTNFRELREEHRLNDRFRFRTTSDTEVVLRLYEALGIEMLQHLTGMFAFCIHDAKRGKTFVVRDFYGNRPLFFMQNERRVYFASEIKAFLDLDDFGGKVDHEAIYHYLGLAYIPGDRTPFEDIRELRGGELLEIDARTGKVDRRRYYEPRYDTDHSMTEREAADRLFVEMRESVRRNLISDAPLGATLSGGFDTSSILALARDIHGDQEIHTFSVAMDESSFDESPYQRMMVDHTNAIHHEVRVTPQHVLDHMIEHMAYMDEPSGNGACVPSYLLSREASKYVKVLLSGEGGDETFNAYETHLAYKARKLYRKCVPKVVRDVARKTAWALPTDYRKLSFDYVAKRFTAGTELSTPEAHFYWRHVLLEEQKRALMPNHSSYRPTPDLFSELFDSLDYDDDLNRISRLDIEYYFIDDLMVKNDRTFMAHSVEARFPYMDRLLLEFVASVPTNLRIKRFTRRYLQKEAVKHLLPKAIYKRKNFGLEMPHSLWFLGGFKPLAEKYFSRESVERTGFLDFETVDSLWQDHLSGRFDYGRPLWCILNLMIWFDLFVVNKDYKQYLRS